MLVVGRCLVPLLGGVELQLSLDLGWFLLMVLSTSVAAVGLALLIAARSKAFDQAAALGGGANVILGTLAGIMVPRQLMPVGMQTISEWSLMGWALDGMQAVSLAPRRRADSAQGHVAHCLWRSLSVAQLATNQSSRSGRLGSR